MKTAVSDPFAKYEINQLFRSRITGEYRTLTRENLYSQQYGLKNDAGDKMPVTYYELQWEWDLV
jgi:hypothetical protein